MMAASPPPPAAARLLLSAERKEHGADYFLNHEAIRQTTSWCRYRANYLSVRVYGKNITSNMDDFLNLH